MSRDSQEIQEAFEELLGELPPSRRMSRQVSSAAFDEARDLLALSEQVRGLGALSAPTSLRQTALLRAFSRPVRRQRGVLSHVPSFLHDWRFTASRVVAPIGAALLLGVGTLASSAASLPNSPLYSVKLFVQDVRVVVTPSDDRPKIYIEQAKQAVADAQQSLQDNRIDDASQAVSVATQRLSDADSSAANTANQAQVRAQVDAVKTQVDSVASVIEDHGVVPPALVAGPGAPPTQVRPEHDNSVISGPGFATAIAIVAPTQEATEGSGGTQTVVADTSSTGGSREATPATVAPTPKADPTAVYVGAPRSDFQTLQSPVTANPTARALATQAQALPAGGTVPPTSVPATPPPTATTGVHAPSGGFTPIVPLSQGPNRLP